MTRFDHLNSATWHAVAVACDHEALKIARPMVLDGFGHRRGSLARADNNGAPLWRSWKIWRKAAFRRCRGDCFVE